MKTGLTIAIVLIIAAGGYFIFVETTKAPTVSPIAMTNTNGPAMEATTPTPAQTQTTTVTQKATMVTYDGTTFSPASVSIHIGDTVTFTNTGSGPMWVASDPHPAHSGYSGTTKDRHCPDTAGTAFDQCTVGSSYTFTFAKVGSWGYHNHINHSATGTIVVTK